MILRREARDSKWVVDGHLAARVRMSAHINYTSLLRLHQHRRQQVRQQKWSQKVHLQMRLKSVARLNVRMER